LSGSSLAERSCVTQSNLDADEALFLAVNAGGKPGWRVYVNPPCVVVGRHQRIEWEVNLEEAEASRVPVLRRFTGGGAVYHDEGNLNFAVCEARPGSLHAGCLDYARYSRWLLGLLDGLELDGALEGNRVDVKGRKVSGLASRVGKRAVFVHGTLLVSTDLERLRALLRVPPSRRASLAPPRGPHVLSVPREETTIAIETGRPLAVRELLEEARNRLGEAFPGVFSRP